jgi:hypothetical protein
VDRDYQDVRDGVAPHFVGWAAARGMVPSTGLSVVVVGLLLFIGTATAGLFLLRSRALQALSPAVIGAQYNLLPICSLGLAYLGRIRDHSNTLLGCLCGRDRDRIVASGRAFARGSDFAGSFTADQQESYEPPAKVVLMPWPESTCVSCHPRQPNVWRSRVIAAPFAFLLSIPLGHLTERVSQQIQGVS